MDASKNEAKPVCPICSHVLMVKLAHGRKSGKAFVMLQCPVDGRHFRAFISDRSYVQQVVEKLESLKSDKDGSS